MTPNHDIVGHMKWSVLMTRQDLLVLLVENDDTLFESLPSMWSILNKTELPENHLT